MASHAVRPSMLPDDRAAGISACPCKCVSFSGRREISRAIATRSGVGALLAWEPMITMCAACWRPREPTALPPGVHGRPTWLPQQCARRAPARRRNPANATSDHLVALDSRKALNGGATQAWQVLAGGCAYDCMRAPSRRHDRCGRWRGQVKSWQVTRRTCYGLALGPALTCHALAQCLAMGLPPSPGRGFTLPREWADGGNTLQSLWQDCSDCGQSVASPWHIHGKPMASPWHIHVDTVASPW